MKKILLALSSMAVLANAAIPAEQVTNIPGLPAISEPLYSGFLPTASKTRTLHYVSALSRNRGSADPVVIYLSGEVGCSSLVNFGLETGPIMWDPRTNQYAVRENAWNNQANVFWVETVASQGFSACPRNESDPNTLLCTFNDVNATADLTLAIVNLMTKKFPEFLRRDVFLASDAYGSVLLPKLAVALTAS